MTKQTTKNILVMDFMNRIGGIRTRIVSNVADFKSAVFRQFHHNPVEIHDLL